MELTVIYEILNTEYSIHLPILKTARLTIFLNHSYALEMAKKSKLLTALDAHKGRDYRLDKQKKLQKQAIKKKKSNTELQKQGEYDEPTPASGSIAQLGLESEGWESDESENAIDVTVN